MDVVMGHVPYVMYSQHTGAMSAIDLESINGEAAPLTFASYTLSLRKWDIVMPFLNGIELGTFYYCPEPTGDHIVPVTLRAPMELPYDGSWDFRAYGSRAQLLGKAGAGRSVYSNLLPPQSEQNVVHATLHGVAYAASLQSYATVGAPRYIFGRSFPTNRYTNVSKYVTGQGMPAEATVGQTETVPDLLGYMEHLRSNLIGYFAQYTGNGYGSGSSSKVLSFDYDYIDGVLSYYATFECRWVKPQAGFTYSTYKVSSYVEFQPDNNFFVRKGIATIGRTSASGCLVTIEDRYSGYVGSPAAGNTGLGAGNPYFRVVGRAISFPKAASYAYNNNPVPTMEPFKAFADDIYYRFIPSIRSAAYISASRAMENARGDLGNNYIETISEMDQAFSLIPSKDILQRVSDLVSSVRLASITSRLVKFADLLADSVLLYKFGLEPLADDLLLVGKAIDRIIDERVSSFKPITCYGKVSTEKLSVNDIPVILTVRSKLVLLPSNDDIVRSVLRMDSAGIMPSASTLWDLLPFSFVVDWFFGVGRKLSLAENYAYAMVLPTWYATHSYTIECDAELIDKRGILHYGAGAKFKYYERRASTWFPSPNQAILAGFDEAAVPVLTGSALTWTILRSS